MKLHSGSWRVEWNRRIRTHAKTPVKVNYVINLSGPTEFNSWLSRKGLRAFAKAQLCFPTISRTRNTSIYFVDLRIILTYSLIFIFLSKVHSFGFLLYFKWGSWDWSWVLLFTILVTGLKLIYHSKITIYDKAKINPKPTVDKPTVKCHGYRDKNWLKSPVRLRF